MRGPNDRGEELTGFHNQGEQDFEKGAYDPPHSINSLSDLLWGKDCVEEMTEDNTAYLNGWNNAKNNH